MAILRKKKIFRSCTLQSWARLGKATRSYSSRHNSLCTIWTTRETTPNINTWMGSMWTTGRMKCHTQVSTILTAIRRKARLSTQLTMKTCLKMRGSTTWTIKVHLDMADSPPSMQATTTTSLIPTTTTRREFKCFECRQYSDDESSGCWESNSFDLNQTTCPGSRCMITKIGNVQTLTIIYKRCASKYPFSSIVVTIFSNQHIKFSFMNMKKMILISS